MPNLGDSTEIAPWRQDGVTREDVRGMFSRLYYVLENEEPVEACVVRHLIDILATWSDNNWDADQGHIWEDHIHRAVLTTIAEGRCWDPAELAGTATKSLELKFPRWYS